MRLNGIAVASILIGTAGCAVVTADNRKCRLGNDLEYGSWPSAPGLVVSAPPQILDEPPFLDVRVTHDDGSSESFHVTLASLDRPPTLSPIRGCDEPMVLFAPTDQRQVETLRQAYVGIRECTAFEWGLGFPSAKDEDSLMRRMKGIALVDTATDATLFACGCARKSAL